jgi:hypothetical protein
MNMDDSKRIDVSKNLREGKIVYKAPKGNWKLMGFYLNPEFRPHRPYTLKTH